MNKRTWHYLLNPKEFGITCSKCGGTNIEWSEYERHIWCYDCEIDDDGQPGIFGGPIPINLSLAMGMHFDRYNMETNEIEIFDLEEGDWTPLSELTELFDSPVFAKDSLQNEKVFESHRQRYGEDIFNRIKQYRELVNDA